MAECFDHIISLGGRCQVSHQLRRIYPGADRAYPFDWLITPDGSLLRLLDDDFADFLRLGDLAEAASSRPEFSYRHMRESRYGTILTHDFKRDVEVTAAWPGVRDKYAFLIDRWRRLLSSDRRILFVRQSYGQTDAIRDDLEDLADAALGARIAAAIGACYPRLSFRVLCLPHRPLPANPTLPAGVALVHVGQRDPWVWTGHDMAWDALMAAYKVQPASASIPA